MIEFPLGRPIKTRLRIRLRHPFWQAAYALQKHSFRLLFREIAANDTESFIFDLLIQQLMYGPIPAFSIKTSRHQIRFCIRLKSHLIRRREMLANDGMAIQSVER